MAIFILDTDAVSAAKGNVDSIASQVDSLASSVSGYDTACEDFDFSGPKGVIAANIQAFSTKIKNAGAIMDSAVTSHTSLQNSLKFDETTAKDPAETPKDSQTPTNPTNPTNPTYPTGPTGPTGPTYPVSPVTPVTPVTPDTTTPQEGTEVSEKITKIDHTKVGNITDAMKAIFDKVSYDNMGYALYGGLMVIACSSAVGKIGDVVELVLSDGTKVRCVVGQNLEGTGEIHFIVNDSWKSDNTSNPTNGILEKISKIYNYGAGAAITTTDLPKIGEHTSKWSTLDDSWTIATTKVSVPDYEKVVASKKITQNSDTSKYGDYCLAFSYVHAYDLYHGVTSDTAADAGNYKHAGSFESFYSDSKAETLTKIYSEIVNGRPVVMQVNGNTSGTSRHFVTVVGFRNTITDPAALTEKDLLIMDSWDGKVERMDQTKSRFMTTGKQTGKSYTGYYLRTIKA